MTDLNTQIKAFTAAQVQGFELMNSVLKNLQMGINERQLVKQITEAAPKFGFNHWFSRPVIHFDYSSRPRIGPSENRVLKPSTVVQIHLKPATDSAYANLGLSFCPDGNPPPIIAAAKELCTATSTYASHLKCVGELFVFATSWANNHRCRLNNERHIGHQCRGPDGVHGLMWPKSARLHTTLRRHQIQWYNPRRLNGIFAIQPDLSSDDRRAGFAEIICVTEDNRWVLGRENMSDIGQWDL